MSKLTDRQRCEAALKELELIGALTDDEAEFYVDEWSRVVTAYRILKGEES